MGLYEASFGLQNAGLITGVDLTPEAALTKLMWLLATEAPDSVLEQMQISLRGEQSQSVFDVRHGPVGSQAKPVEIAKLTLRPSGQFQTAKLTGAMLRISGVGIEGAAPGEKITIAVFVGLPTANADTPTSVPQFAGHLSGVYEGEGTVLLKNITSTIAQVHESGRPLNLNLVPPRGKKLWADGVYLTLFN
jgi:L-asparaginase